LKILDYAVNDAAVQTPRQKEVTLYIDKYGELTSDESCRVGQIKATIDADDPVRGLLVPELCVRKRDGLTADLVESLKEKGELEKLRQAGVFDGQKFNLSGDLKPIGITEDAVKSIFESSPKIADKRRQLESLGPEVRPSLSPFTIPKRRAFRPGDSFLNPYQIQRDLRAIGNPVQ